MLKRALCLLATVVAVCCLFTACGLGESQAKPKVEEMMLSLAEGDEAAAEALMHPDVDQDAKEQLAQIKEYLAGRKVSDMEQKSISVNKSMGTGGKALREEVTYQVMLDDNTEIYVSASYLEDKSGSGFTAFRMSLGI